MLCVSLACRLSAWAHHERAIAADPAREHVVEGDAAGYWDLGCDLAAGREYAVHEPPRRALRPPGVPLVVSASVAAFGERRPPARLIFACLCSAGPSLVYLLASVWLTPAQATGAGLMAAVSPLAVGLSPAILSDGLFAALLTGVCLTAARSLGQHRVGWAAAAGTVSGAAVLVKPSWLPAAVAGAALWPLLGRGWRPAGVCLVATAVVLTPWTLRNAAVVGRATPTTLWAGPTLYDSFRPDADGGSDMRFFDEEAAGRAGLGEAEVDDWYRRRAWRLAVADPVRTLRLAAAKQARFWSPWPAKDSSPAAFRLATAAWSLLLLGAVAVAAARRRGSAEMWLLCLAPLAYFAALHLVFVGSMRYRMPAELPLCVLAAAAFARQSAASSEVGSTETSSR